MLKNCIENKLRSGFFKKLKKFDDTIINKKNKILKIEFLNLLFRIEKNKKTDKIRILK